MSRRARKQTVVLLGGATAKLALNDRWVSEGDSITAASSGIQTWLLPFNWMNNGDLLMAANYNQALGGRTAQTMAGRTASIVAARPKVVSLLGGTNDLAGGATAATVFGYLQTCISAYLAGGASYVILLQILPRVINGTTWTNAMETQRLALNVMLSALASARIKTINFDSIINTATDLQADGLHPNWSGTVKIATAVAPVVAAISNGQDALSTYFSNTNTNFVWAAKNPGLTGTGGTKGTANVTGSIADTWTVTENGGITVVCSKDTSIAGVEGQRIVCSGTSSGAGKLVTLTNAITPFPIVIGDYWEQFIQFSLASGSSGLTDPELYGSFGVTPGPSFTTLNMTTDPQSGIMRTSETNFVTGFLPSYAFNFSLVFAAGAVAADITLWKPILQRVPVSPA